QHARGIMIGAVPQLGIEVPEEAACGRFPRRPEVETHLAQRLQGGRQDGSHMVSLKSRHADSSGPPRGAKRASPIISQSVSREHPTNRAAVNEENLIRQVRGGKERRLPSRRAAVLENAAPCVVSAELQESSTILFCGRGVRTSPRKKPPINPHTCAPILTCGVDRSNAIWITTIITTFPSRCLACGAWRCRIRNPAHAPTMPMIEPDAPIS